MNYGIYTLAEIKENYAYVIIKDNNASSSDQDVELYDDFNNDLAFVRVLNESEV